MNHHLTLRAKIIIMLSVMASLFLVALDQTVISTALGKIVEEFNAFSSLAWVVTAYLITATITVPIAGKLSDLFGRRSMLLVGVGIFAAGSLLAGMSGSIEQLIIWRAVQGIGGGIITANAFTIIGDLFAARERGKWQGFIGAVFGFSSIIGPLLGGFLTEPHNFFGLVTDWRWTMYINVPIAVVAFIVIFIFCPTLKHAKRPKVDYAGASLLAIGLATLVLAIDNTDVIFADLLSSTGMSLMTLRLIMFGIVTVATIGLILVERKAAEPILPPYFFKNRNFVLIMSIALLFGSAFMGAILYLTQFNQQVFGATPTESGLMLLPMVGGLMLTSVLSGQLISRIGKYKIFMQVGFAIATAAVFCLTFLTPEIGYPFEAVVMVALGIGMGVAMPVINLAVQNEFEQKDLGAATSSSQLFRSLGSTVGVALFGAILTAGIVSGLGDMSNNPYVKTLSQNPVASKIGSFNDSSTLLTLNMPDVKSKINQQADNAFKDLPANLADKAKTNFTKDQDEFASIITHTFSDSLRGIFIVSTSLMFVATILVFALKERELKSAKPTDTPGEI